MTLICKTSGKIYSARPEQSYQPQPNAGSLRMGANLEAGSATEVLGGNTERAHKKLLLLFSASITLQNMK